MNHRITIGVFGGIVLGFILCVLTRTVLPISPPRAISSILPAEEANYPTDWVEYRKGDWHIIVAWVHDNIRKEARIYAYLMEADGNWKLKESDRIAYVQDRLEYVDIDYPDRNAFLMNDQRLSIRGVILHKE